MPKQFWVIGGEYRNTEFHQLIDGTGRVHGPFTSYAEAKAKWSERALASRHEATTRYTIVASTSATDAARAA